MTAQSRNGTLKSDALFRLGIENALVPSPSALHRWSDRSLYLADVATVEGYVNKAIEDLSDRLDDLHGVRPDQKYWKIIIGPWLTLFVHVLFERWSSIKNYSDPRSLFDEWGSEISGNYAADMREFSRFVSNSAWNEQLVIQLLAIRINSDASKTTLIKTSPARFYLRSQIKNILKDSVLTVSAVWRTFATKIKGGYVSVELGSSGKLSQGWFKGKGFVLTDYKLPKSITAFAAKRHAPRAATVDNIDFKEFERVLDLLIPLHIPSAYIENFEWHLKLGKLLLPDRPDAILTSNSHYADEIFKVWVASKVAIGTPLYILQHGGHYGIARWAWIEDHDISVADKFISWGWSSPHADKIIPGGCPLPNQTPTEDRREDSSDIVLAPLNIARYSGFMYAFPSSNLFSDYVQQQIEFLKFLGVELLDRVVIKLDSNEYGWNISGRFREELDCVTILDDPKCEFNDVLRGCKLVVATYNATTMLESIFQDIPTVIWWNQDWFEVRESFTDVLDTLKKAKIFFPDAESAAHHVASYYHDINSWWDSGPVREARSMLIDRYAASPITLQDVLMDLQRK